MGQMIKFDFYKLIKSVSTWILLLCVIVFSAVSLTITYVAKNDGDLPDVALEIGEQTTIIPLDEMTIVDWCIDSISGDFLMLFTIVFAILFSCNDFATGFIKNIYNTIKSKWHYVFSKFIVVAIFSLITMLTTYLVTIIFNIVVVYPNAFGGLSDLLRLTFYKAILLISYGCIGVLVSFAIRKATTGLILCMGYSFMFANLIYTGINQIVKGMGVSESFDIQKYTLIGNTISVSSNVSSEQQIIILIVCGATIISSFVGSSVLFSKKDI